MPELSEIPLNEIIHDWRVKEYIRKKAFGLAKKEIKRYQNYQSQILYCHAWLLTLHYQAVTRLQERYSLSKPEFITLLGLYLLKRIQKSYVYAKDLKELLAWEHNRIYRHLKKLSAKGYVHIEKNIYNRRQRYSITSEGYRVIRAFSQHYWRVFHEVVDKWRELPDTFLNRYF